MAGPPKEEWHEKGWEPRNPSQVLIDYWPSKEMNGIGDSARKYSKPDFSVVFFVFFKDSDIRCSSFEINKYFIR